MEVEAPEAGDPRLKFSVSHEYFAKASLAAQTTAAVAYRRVLDVSVEHFPPGVEAAVAAPQGPLADDAEMVLAPEAVDAPRAPVNAARDAADH